MCSNDVSESKSKHHGGMDKIYINIIHNIRIRIRIRIRITLFRNKHSA